MRRRSMPALTALLLALAAPAAGLEPQRSKVAAALRLSAERAERNAPLEGLPSLVERDARGGLFARVIVRTEDPGRTVRAIEELGGTSSTSAGAYVVARVPVAAVRLLAARAEVVSVAGSHRLRPALDASRADIRADQVHAGAGLPRPFTGRGVVVGIVDTGVDLSLPDFRDAAGKTRLLSFWDQSRPGKPPAGFTNGWECTQTEIDAGACPLTDPASSVGHGTHVAGIAAGNGLGRPGTPYRGIAPEADLVVVRGFADEADIVDGCRYVFEKAAAAGRPAVVNLSSGHHYGSHDGETSFERALAALLGPGRILVAAAGNEGALPVHLGYPAQGSDFASGTSTDIRVSSGAHSALAYAVASGPHVSLGIKASVTTGGQRVPCDEIGPVRPGEKVAERPLKCGTTAIGTAEIDGTEATGGGLPAFTVYVSNGGNAAIDISKSNWELTAFGDARLDAWMADGNLFGTATGGRWRPGDSSMTIRLPATAPEVIAAGADTTKLGWVDLDGVARTFLNLPSTAGQCGPAASAAVGGAACFTSRGPARDGRTKPDLAAPGQVVVAPLATSVDLTNPSWRVLAVQGGGYRAFQGTSMSAPHVAGTVALMLQANGALTPTTTRRLLQRAARSDATTGATPNDVWGAGKLDALAAVRAVVDPVTRWIPILLDAPGLGGARYTTELTLANRGTSAATVALVYTPAAALGASGGGSASLDLFAGRQLVIPDALAFLRGKGVPIPAEGSQGGTLRVTFTGLSSPDAAFAGARTTTPSGSGRAGLSYPGLAPEECFTSAAWVHALRESAADRSHLALVNVNAGSSATLRVTLWEGARSVPIGDVALGPGEWVQLARVLSFAGLSSGSARVELVSGPGPFTTYGVVNDNLTNDGSFIAPQPAASPAEPLTLPVLVETPLFSSELVLRNPSERSAALTLSYAESLAPAGGGGTFTESLAPLEQRIVPDAIEWLRANGIALGARGSASFAGALKASFRVDGSLAPGYAAARTATRGPAGGTGLFCAAAGSSNAAPDEAWLFGLRQDGSVRTNVAVANAGESALTFDLQIFDGDTGNLSGPAQRFSLPPGGWKQLDAPLASLGVRSGYARVVKVSGSGAFLAYAVVNDGATPTSGGTNDGSYVAAAR